MPYVCDVLHRDNNIAVNFIGHEMQKYDTGKCLHVLMIVCCYTLFPVSRNSSLLKCKGCRHNI